MDALDPIPRTGRPRLDFALAAAFGLALSGGLLLAPPGSPQQALLRLGAWILGLLWVWNLAFLTYRIASFQAAADQDSLTRERARLAAIRRALDPVRHGAAAGLALVVGGAASWAGFPGLGGLWFAAAFLVALAFHAAMTLATEPDAGGGS